MSTTENVYKRLEQIFHALPLLFKNIVPLLRLKQILIEVFAKRFNVQNVHVLCNGQLRCIGLLLFSVFIFQFVSLI